VHRSHFLATLAFFILTAPPSLADLRNVDRTIAKEPAYTSKPKYCLLVFGPSAKSRFWLVVDGDTLYVDRKGNGDLTENGKQVALPAFEKSDNEMILEHRRVDVGDLSDGSGTHTALVLDQYRFRRDFVPKTRDEKEGARLIRSTKDGTVYGATICTRQSSGGTCQQVAAIDSGGLLEFADSPREAPVIHFGGSYEMRFGPVQKLVRGKTCDLEASVGTPGLGKGTFAILMYTELSDPIPDGAHPIAEIVFPGKTPASATPSTKVILDHRC
jgi:hypothetical protein